MNRLFLALLVALSASSVAGAETFQLGDKPDKPTPTTSDRLLITDSAAANAVKRIDIANLPVSTPIQNAINSAVAAKQDPLSGNCTGQILIGFSQAGVPVCESLPTIPSLIGDLSNVDVTGANTGDALIFNESGGLEVGQITGTDDQTAAEVPFSSAGFTAANTLDAILELDTEKADKSNISFTAGILSDLKITLTDTSTSPLIDDTVTYGDVDDDLRVGSIEYYGGLLAGKADTSDLASQVAFEAAFFTLPSGDDNQTATEVPFTAYGTLDSSANVQAALQEVADEKADKNNISFTAGALSDIKITLTDASTSPIFNDTVTYGGVDDHLRGWTVQQIGSELAGKADASDLASQVAFEAAFFTLPSGSSSYVATPWTYSDETCSPGQYAADSSNLYVCVSSGNILQFAGTSGWNPTPLPPTLTSTTVDSSGNEADLVFNETVTVSGYTTGDFDLDCTTAGNDIALSSPVGSGANWSFVTASTVYSGDTCNIDFNGAANSIENSSNVDLESITDGSVTVVGATPAVDWTPATLELYESSNVPATNCAYLVAIYDSSGNLVASGTSTTYSAADTYVSQAVSGTPTDISPSSTYYIGAIDNGAVATTCRWGYAWPTGSSTYGTQNEGGTWPTPTDPVSVPTTNHTANHDEVMARVKNASGQILVEWGTAGKGGEDQTQRWAETRVWETSATSNASPQ